MNDDIFDLSPPDKKEKSQADRILYKFGGPRHLRDVLKAIGRPRNLSSIYRWTYPKEDGGTGGLIPTSAWPDLHVAAHFDGVIITSEDMDPRELKLKLHRWQREELKRGDE